MTTSLIDPAAVDAIKARQANAPKFDLTPARAARLTDKQRVDAIFVAAHTLGKIFDEIQDDATDLGTWIFTAAQTSAFTLDLFLYAAQLFASPHPDPRKALREKTRETLTVIGTTLRDHLQEQGEAMEAGLRAKAEEQANTKLPEAQARIEEERALLTHAADQAQADATEARRQLDAASTQLTREREAHAHEVIHLREQLARERQAVIDRDRETRNRIQQLEYDHAEHRKVIAHLNAECERLEALAATPQETPMPEPTPGPQNTLETASLCHYLNWRQDAAYRWDGLTIRDDAQPVNVTDPNILTAWRARYPTPASMREQLRALIRPALQRSAA